MTGEPLPVKPRAEPQTGFWACPDCRYKTIQVVDQAAFDAAVEGAERADANWEQVAETLRRNADELEVRAKTAEAALDVAVELLRKSEEHDGVIDETPYTLRRRAFLATQEKP